MGGVALQRWGEPRLTQDVDLTLLTGFGDEEQRRGSASALTRNEPDYRIGAVENHIEKAVGSFRERADPAEILEDDLLFDNLIAAKTQPPDLLFSQCACK